MARNTPRMKELNIEIGKRISLARVAAGMTQERLASMCDITHQQFYKYEKGTNRVTAARLQLIAEALNQPIQFFFSINVDSLGYDCGKKINIEFVKNYSALQDTHQKEALNNLVKTLI